MTERKCDTCKQKAEECSVILTAGIPVADRERLCERLYEHVDVAPTPKA